MDFQVVEDALAEYVTDSTGLRAVWMNQPRPNMPRPFATLHKMAFTPVGMGDEIRYEEVDIDPTPVTTIELAPTVCGFRQLSVRIRFISRDQRAGQDGPFYVERAMIALRRPTIKAALQEAGLAFVSMRPLLNQDEVFDDRHESIAALDLIFNVASTITDAEDQTQYVSKVEITSDHVPDDQLGMHEQLFGDLDS